MWKEIIAWFKNLFHKLEPEIKRFLNEILFPLLVEVGKESFKLFVQLIIEAASKDMTNEQKRDWVTEKFKEQWTGRMLSDSEINSIRENAYLEYKRYWS